MNEIYRYLLRAICKRLVVQDCTHKANITEYYAIMRQAAEAEFTEDNKPTLDAFLKECHENT